MTFIPPPGEPDPGATDGGLVVLVVLVVLVALVISPPLAWP